ncbi:MAG: adenosine deaminase [Ilumatobacter sp.]
MAFSEAEAIAFPKVLLHDHLDGGLRPATVFELADEIGWTLPADTLDDLEAWFHAGAATKDLPRALAMFEHTCAVMQRADHLERIAAECVADLAADGVVYAEVRFAPEQHQQHGLQLDEVVEAVTAGFRRGEAEASSEICVNTILCAMRTEDRSLEIAKLVDSMRAWDDKVVAFDLAGAETGFPPSLHAEALAFARRTQQNITIHASEAPDLPLIAEALEYGAHRIGHGVRLQADISFAPDGSIDVSTGLGPLARHVYDHQIHLEMAPTCHVHVGAVESFGDHPMVAMLRAGFDIGVNTDNRLMSGVTASSELHALSNTFALTDIERKQLSANAAMASFAPLEQRRRLVESL